MPYVLTKKSKEGTPQYLAKGRSIFDASGNINYSNKWKWDKPVWFTIELFSSKIHNIIRLQ
jgi:hypothetical protein